MVAFVSFHWESRWYLMASIIMGERKQDVYSLIKCRNHTCVLIAVSFCLSVLSFAAQNSLIQVCNWPNFNGNQKTTDESENFKRGQPRFYREIEINHCKLESRSLGLQRKQGKARTAIKTQV